MKVINRVLAFPFQFIGSSILSIGLLIRFGLDRTTVLLNKMGQVIIDERVRNEGK